MPIMKYFVLFVILISVVACQIQLPKNTENDMILDDDSRQASKENAEHDECKLQLTVVMKGVGIYTPQSDFYEMKSACIDVVTTEWGMEEGIDDVKTFLDRANNAGLKVVLDGGFSLNAWGFSGDDWDSLPEGKSPVWQKNRVQEWINTFKDHPAVYAWDICNEYGENLPSGAHAVNSRWPETVITLEQLKQARQDVLQVDNSKPILIRMYDWDLNEPPFGVDRPYEAGLVDIVMINLYSNYARDNNILWPEMIADSGAEFVRAVKKVDPNVEVWIALAAFKAPDMFLRPTTKSLDTDIKETLKISEVDGIAFFEWGPANQFDPEINWYLPENGADLWETIKKNLRDD